MASSVDLASEKSLSPYHRFAMINHLKKEVNERDRYSLISEKSFTCKLNYFLKQNEEL